MRNRLIEILEKKPPHTNFSPLIAIQNDADYLIENDVVPVVKCHKCKYWCELKFGRLVRKRRKIRREK